MNPQRKTAALNTKPDAQPDQPARRPTQPAQASQHSPSTHRTRGTRPQPGPIQFDFQPTACLFQPISYGIQPRGFALRPCPQVTTRPDFAPNQNSPA